VAVQRASFAAAGRLCAACPGGALYLKDTAFGPQTQGEQSFFGCIFVAFFWAAWLWQGHFLWWVDGETPPFCPLRHPRPKDDFLQHSKYIDEKYLTPSCKIFTTDYNSSHRKQSL
jgi:hypothetical protein